MNTKPIRVPRSELFIGVVVLAISAIFMRHSALGGVPADRILDDFDLRQSMSERQGAVLDGAALQQLAARSGAVGRLEIAVPGLQIDWSPLLDTPGFVRSTQGFLTPPSGPDAELLPLVVAFVAKYHELFRLGDDPLRGLTVIREGTTTHNGVRTIWLGQSIDGVSILGCDLRVNITRDGRIVSIGSRLLDLESGLVVVSRGAISAADAIKAAAESIGIVSVKHLAAVGRSEFRGKQRFTADQCAGTLSVENFFIPMGRTQIRLGARVVLQAVGDPNVYAIVVAGDTGEVLIRHNLSRTVIEPATYRVFENADPTPFSPGPPFPNGFQPPPEQRSLITIGALDPEASPDGWIPAGVNTTIGNNVAAHADVNFDNVPDLPRPQGPDGRVFDFSFTVGAPAESNLDAAVTQAFYTGNWFHDVMYGYGFTESFGNYQESNFGRGGISNDPLQIDVLDGGGENNARFISSGDDGSDGRIELFLWSNETESRNSAFDTQVLLHELAHSVSVRLHGGLNGIHADGMAEGWSDFYALALLARASDNAAGIYPIGSYLAITEADPSFLDNYYFGIRRYPYSIDFNANPLTFSDIDPQQFDVDVTAPRNPLVPFDNPGRVHQVGEIWCQILWECRAEMIQAHGFVGNEMMLRLVTDAMKLTTTSEPNMVIGRDAILLADLVNFDGENLCRLWDAFARRGLGTQAAAPPNGLNGIVESFESISEPMLRTLIPAPTLLTPGEVYPIVITVDPGCAGAAPVTPVELHVSLNGGPFKVSQAILETSTLFHTQIPAFECGDQIDFYFTIEFDTGAIFDPPLGGSQPYQAVAEIRQDLSRFRASDRQPFDFFGFDVDIDGDTVAVGAFQEDEAGFDSGSVYIFHVSPTGEWEETAKLIHPTNEGIANFGYSVAIQNNTLAAGAIGDDLHAPNAGAAYVFDRSTADAWTLVDALVPLDGESGDRFGAAIDTEGDLTIVGAPGNDTAGMNAGAVYVYSRNGAGHWSQASRILAKDAGASDSFGHSVSIWGDTIAIGAPGKSLSAGAVYLYHRTSPGQWTLITKLEAVKPQDGALFGSRVHLNGDQLAVSAIQDHDFFQNVGAAYIFRNHPELGWEFKAKLIAPDQRSLDEFGSGVAVEGDLALVGARRSNSIGADSGAVYSYLRNPDGTWSFLNKIIPDELQPRVNLGNALSLDNGLAIVGAWTDGVDESITGAVYLIRPIATDCDGNGIADACDIASGTLMDFDGDGVPDRCQCTGDLNGDRLVDTADLGLLLNQFGVSDQPLADINLDGLVDQVDLGLLLGSFGLECTSDAP